MKNKLAIGLTLIITLLLAVQVTAMETTPTVNPYLEPWMKRQLRESIANFENKFIINYDPKKPLNPGETWEERSYQAALMGAKLKAYKAMYYGDRPYTWEEMNSTIASYVNQVDPLAYQQ